MSVLNNSILSSSSRKVELCLIGAETSLLLAIAPVVNSVPLTAIYLSILGVVADILAAVILLVIGILVIVFLVRLAIVLLPAIIISIIIWFFTGSFFYAGIAFLIVALVSLVAKI